MIDFLFSHIKEIIIATIAIIVIFSVIEHIVIYKGKDADDSTETEKTMRAIRTLIYIVIFLIITSVIIRLFFWTAFLEFFKR